MLLLLAHAALLPHHAYTLSLLFTGKDGKRKNFEAAAAALEAAVAVGAAAAEIDAKAAAKEKARVKLENARNGVDTAKGVGWINNGKQNDTLQ